MVNEMYTEDLSDSSSNSFDALRRRINKEVGFTVRLKLIKDIIPNTIGEY